MKLEMRAKVTGKGEKCGEEKKEKKSTVTEKNKRK